MKLKCSLFIYMMKQNFIYIDILYNILNVHIEEIHIYNVLVSSRLSMVTLKYICKLISRKLL